MEISEISVIKQKFTVKMIQKKWEKKVKPAAFLMLGMFLIKG